MFIPRILYSILKDAWFEHSIILIQSSIMWDCQYSTKNFQIFPTFNLNVEIFHGILSFHHNNIMDPNNIMEDQLA